MLSEVVLDSAVAYYSDEVHTARWLIVAANLNSRQVTSETYLHHRIVTEYMAACLRFTRQVWKSFLDNKGHDAQCFPNLAVTRATPGIVEASLKVESYNLNRVGTVHGGLIMSLTDTLGSLAVATKGHYMTGVSTDIGTSFVKPAGRTGDVLHAKAVLTGIGKSLAYTRVEFNSPTGELLAYGHHTKYIGKSSVHAKNVKFSDDGETLVEGEYPDVQ